MAGALAGTIAGAAAALAASVRAGAAGATRGDLEVVVMVVATPRSGAQAGPIGGGRWA